MHPFTIDPEGNLFVNRGSATNSCQVKDRQPGSPGERPCKELETRAGIWRFSATRTGQRFAPARATPPGSGMPVGLAINPADGALYATQHGRDQLAENWPKLYDWKQSAELPAEELLQVVKGGDYGWPYCYYDPAQGEAGAGAGVRWRRRQGRRVRREARPGGRFPAHWAPNALASTAAKRFPEAYRGGAFIAFHGSWNRAPEPQDGYNVVFQPFSGGKAVGTYQVFADGFAGPRKEPGTAKHRPPGWRWDRTGRSTSATTAAGGSGGWSTAAVSRPGPADCRPRDPTGRGAAVLGPRAGCGSTWRLDSSVHDSAATIVICRRNCI